MLSSKILGPDGESDGQSSFARLAPVLFYHLPALCSMQALLSTRFLPFLVWFRDWSLGAGGQ